MKILTVVGLTGFLLIVTVSLALWSSGWHVFTLPFSIPFAVMLLIVMTNRKKEKKVGTESDNET